MTETKKLTKEEAAAVGLSLEELPGAVALLTQSGLSTAEAMTALRAVLTAVVKPEQQALETAELLGIEFSND